MPCLLFMLTLHPNHQKYNMPQTLHIAIIGGGAAGFFAGDRGQAQLPSRRHHDFRKEFEGSRQGGNYGRETNACFRNRRIHTASSTVW